MSLLFGSEFWWNSKSFEEFPKNYVVICFCVFWTWQCDTKKKAKTSLKSNISNFTLIVRTPFDYHRFLQVLSHFRGFDPHLRRFFSSEIWYQMVFFMCFNILESYVIKIRGQDNLKTEKCLQEIIKIKIAIYLCSIDIISLKIFSVAPPVRHPSQIRPL